MAASLLLPVCERSLLANTAAAAVAAECLVGCASVATFDGGARGAGELRCALHGMFQLVFRQLRCDW